MILKFEILKCWPTFFSEDWRNEISPLSSTFSFISVFFILQILQMLQTHSWISCKCFVTKRVFLEKHQSCFIDWSTPATLSRSHDYHYHHFLSKHFKKVVSLFRTLHTFIVSSTAWFYKDLSSIKINFLLFFYRLQVICNSVDYKKRLDGIYNIIERKHRLDDRVKKIQNQASANNHTDKDNDNKENIFMKNVNKKGKSLSEEEPILCIQQVMSLLQ